MTWGWVINDRIFFLTTIPLRQQKKILVLGNVIYYYKYYFLFIFHYSLLYKIIIGWFCHGRIWVKHFLMRCTPLILFTNNCLMMAFFFSKCTGSQTEWLELRGCRKTWLKFIFQITYFSISVINGASSCPRRGPCLKNDAITPFWIGEGSPPHDGKENDACGAFGS